MEITSFPGGVTTNDSAIIGKRILRRCPVDNLGSIYYHDLVRQRWFFFQLIVVNYTYCKDASSTRLMLLMHQEFKVFRWQVWSMGSLLCPVARRSHIWERTPNPAKPRVAGMGSTK